MCRWSYKGNLAYASSRVTLFTFQSEADLSCRAEGEVERGVTPTLSQSRPLYLELVHVRLGRVGRKLKARRMGSTQGWAVEVGRRNIWVAWGRAPRLVHEERDDQEQDWRHHQEARRHQCKVHLDSHHRVQRSRTRVGSIYVSG